MEKREGVKEGFGRGRKQRMRFGELLDRLAAGDDSLYLTTQQVGSSVRAFLDDSSSTCIMHSCSCVHNRYP